MRLYDHCYDKYSQFGEDGILERIFGLIGVEHKQCMEFGAWDGLKMSNTARLWRDSDWRAVLVEADKSKFDILLKNVEGRGVECYNLKVEAQGSNSVDALLNGRELDLISIDIDGDDWLVWENMASKPRVVAVEYNCTIPLGMVMAQAPGEYFGASAQAMIDIGCDKRYTLVEMTRTNCIFVLDKYVPLFKDYDLDPAHMFDPRFLIYAVSAYDRRLGLTKRDSAWGHFDRDNPKKIELSKGVLY